jgi:hypothetical protein
MTLAPPSSPHFTLLAIFVCVLFFVVNMNVNIEKMSKTADDLQSLLFQYQYEDVPEKGTPAYLQEERKHIAVVQDLLREHLTLENVNNFGK